jgi:ornithine carbamoyltransferase
MLARRLLSDESVHDADEKVLELAARALQRASGSSAGARPLRGRHVALVCASHQCGPAKLFEAAATELGARVSRVAPIDMRADQGVKETAHLLGKLYDAIECDHLSGAEAARLQHVAGIPVFNGLGRSDHRLQRMARCGSGIEPSFVVQAVLLETIA